MKCKPYLLFFLLSLFVVVSSCKKGATLFQAVSSGYSGIHFNNRIVENDSINPIDVTNLYNGGGVGIGDFNNDGLPDIYFTGNLVPNKLYINRGSLKFDDITEKAGVTGNGKWCRGVAVVDINNDGWQDLYVCASMLHDAVRRENLLYINQGNDKTGIPRFKEEAKEYGLADTTHSTMAAFFDYDNDGDLDMYLVVNEILDKDIPSVFRPKITDGSHPSTGRLYRNDGVKGAVHPVFSNISKEAGITIEGYGHSVNICDINKDGRKDIFVTNDFNSNDLLYINNGPAPASRNGGTGSSGAGQGAVTFTDKAAVYFKHTSANGMGQDVTDINNDGLSDVVELDMNPEDNYRKKMMMGPNSYQLYQNSDYYGYQYQYVRNTLQLNEGPRVGANDSTGDPVFSDIGFFAGIAQTDWSWTPLVTDFDNDGFRDIIITNGFPKDVTDHDFIAFRKSSYSIAAKDFTLAQIPQVKLHNYGFRNGGDLTFTNTTTAWGLTTPTFSNGAAYADLDNDGDMDIVINNINDEASLYRNTAADKKEKANYVAVKLHGDEQNINGLGAWVEIYYGHTMQVYEQSPYRGYLSTVQLNPQFGVGSAATLDSVLVKWPNGMMQVLKNVPTGKTIEVFIRNATRAYTWKGNAVAPATLLTDVTDSLGIHYGHTQKDFVDFNIQKLLPHKFSEYGPALAVGDVDGNGLDDMTIGGSSSAPATILLQQPGGSFTEKKLEAEKKQGNNWQDEGLLLFDADGDGDLDLFIARGGYEAEAGSALYGDKLFINEGRGVFRPDSAALPLNRVSKSCVRAVDYDKDSDLDLFIAGRVEPWSYPKPVSSFIYRNDSRGGIARFTDVTAAVAAPLINVGLVCDAVWTDFDGDGWQDLVLAGEWMPLRFLKNEKGRFTDVTGTTGIGNKKGWWTSLVAGDFDNDGDMDYIAGNTGLNSFYKASGQYPVKIYAKDFDKNGSYDAVPTLFLPASQTDTVRREYPAHTRDDITKQLISFKAKFQDYKSYASATFDKMFTKEELNGALVVEANDLANSYIENLGGGKFRIAPLPAATQYSCMNGMLPEDIDGDGNLDVLITGNDYGTEVSVGRYDACNGLLLKGNGRGGFTPLTITQSGWFVPGNGKSLVKLRGAKGATLIAASQNKGPLKIVRLKRGDTLIRLEPADETAVLTYRNGKKQKRETGYGTSFLSQSGRFLNVTPDVASVDIKNTEGIIRTIKF